MKDKTVQEIEGERLAKIADPDYSYDFKQRILRAAAAGGATVNEVFELEHRLWLADMNFDRLQRIIESGDLQRADSRKKSDSALAVVNSTPTRGRKKSGREYTKVPITDAERERVLALDKALTRQNPVTAVRHREISKRLKMTERRVRHIVEQAQRQR